MFGVGKFRILDWMGSESGPLPRRHCGKGQRRSRALSIDPFFSPDYRGNGLAGPPMRWSGLAGELPDVGKLSQPGPAARRGRADPAPRAAAASARPASRCESRLCSLQREILADAARGRWCAMSPTGQPGSTQIGTSGRESDRRGGGAVCVRTRCFASSRNSCRCSPIPTGKCCSGVLGWRGGCSHRAGRSSYPASYSLWGTRHPGRLGAAPAAVAPRT
jgi:hypothetical protein